MIVAKNITPEQLALIIRRHKAGRLYVQGKAQWEIGEALGVDQATISRDLKALQKEWLAYSAQGKAEHVAQELAKLDELERTAREAWERSCKPAEIMHAGTTKGRTAKDGTPLPDLVKSYKTVKGQAGDPRFLERIGWCIDERAKILGLVNQKHEHTGPNGGPIPHEHDDVTGLTDEELVRRYQAKVRGVGAGGEGS